MSTGLPVLVSPNGGMAELIEHGESGWIARDRTAAALASALRMALETSPSRRAKMGQNAEEAVHRHCSNSAVVKRHLELRRKLVEDTAVHAPVSATLPAKTRQGMAVVVACGDQAKFLPPCLAQIECQTQPAALVLVTGSSLAMELCGQLGVEFVEASETRTREAAVRRMFDAVPNLCAAVFVDAAVQLEPQCLATVESVFQRQPRIGMMAGFLAYSDQADDLGLTPNVDAHSLEFPDDCHCVAVRAEVLQHQPAGDAEWATVRYPGILASVPTPKPVGASPEKRYSAMALAQRTSSKLLWAWFLAAPVAEKARCVGRVLFQPRRTAQWLSWQLRALSVGTR
jgi:hypothetical protein